MNEFQFDNAYSQRCLKEIDDLSTKLYAQLQPTHPAFSQGGCLILGRDYARSPYLYCGLNPGLIKNANHDLAVGPCEETPYNSPFVCRPGDESFSRPYFRNCRTFLDAHPVLRNWFDNGVTSTFLVPWRTKGLSDLWALNEHTEKKLLGCSGEIFCKMVEHHQAKLLVLGGKNALPLLNYMAKEVDPNSHFPMPECYQGPGGTYQWSRTCLTLNGRDICVLQLPHFSRANSLRLLEPFEVWLREQLREFGCE